MKKLLMAVVVIFIGATNSYAVSVGCGVCPKGFSCCQQTGQCAASCKSVLITIDGIPPKTLTVLAPGTYFSCVEGAHLDQNFGNFKGHHFFLCSLIGDEGVQVNELNAKKFKPSEGILYTFQPAVPLACEDKRTPLQVKEAKSKNLVWKCPEKKDQRGHEDAFRRER